MENNFYHFSSPTQNNDIILYHQRSKSSLIGSQPSRSKGKLSIKDTTKDIQTTTSRLERNVHQDLNVGLPRPLQDRMNVPKVALDNVSGLSKLPSSILGVEIERRYTELDEENKDLKRQLKVRETKIRNLLKENEEIQDKLDEAQKFENRNMQLQTENMCLKSELEALAKRVNELEDEKHQILTGKPPNLKVHEHDDTGHNLMKYTSYIVNRITSMDKNTFAHFYFGERFSSEKDLQTLIHTEEYGTIALQAFRYISDLLAHVTSSGQSQANNVSVQQYTSVGQKKESTASANEQSSISYDSRKTTPRDAGRGIENKNILPVENDKGKEWRTTSPYRISSSEIAKKKVPKDRGSLRPGNMRKESAGSTGHIGKAKKIDSSGVSLKNSRLNTSQTSGRVDSRPKQRMSKEEDAARNMSGVGKKRRESEEKRGYDSEKSYMLLGNVTDVRYNRENEGDLNESRKGAKRDSFSILEKGLESDSNKYYSVSGNGSTRRMDESLGLKGLQDSEKNEKGNESVLDRDSREDVRPAISVRSILEQGLGQEDPKSGEREVQGLEGKGEKNEVQKIKRPFSLINRPNYEHKEKKQEANEAIGDEKKPLLSSVDSSKERPFAQINLNTNRVGEDDTATSKKRFKCVEVNLNLENQDIKGLSLAQETLNNRNVQGKVLKALNISYGENTGIQASEDRNVYPSTTVAQPQIFDKLKEISSENLKNYKEKVRPFVMQTPERPFYFENKPLKSNEKVGERFVTFDGTDNQNLFTGSVEKEIPAERKVDSKDAIQEFEVSSIKIGSSQQSGRVSSDSNIASIDSNRRKIANQSPQTFELLSGLSIESNRVRQSRGEFNSQV